LTNVIKVNINLTQAILKELPEKLQFLRFINTSADFYMKMAATATVAILASASLGDVTPTQAILFVLHLPRKPTQVKPVSLLWAFS